MMTDREIQEAMDACRPGSADLQQAELAALADAIRCDAGLRRRWECSQRFDARVRNALVDVPVPAGLEERLLAAVESPSESAADGVIAPSLACAAGAPAGDEIRTGPGHAGRWPWAERRRVWTVISGSLVAIAALAGFVLLVPYFRVSEPRADDRLPDEILAWSDTVVRQGWKDDLSSAQALARPLDRAIRANPQRWCSIATAYDAQTLVYDVAPPGGEMALVFCMHCPVSRTALPQIPPWNGFSATGGLTLGVWRRGGLVYVLVVRGGPSRYRQFIEASPLIGLLIGAPFSPIATA